MKSFEELEVWKVAREIRIFVSKVVKTFPPEEKYRLSDQLIRSSRSIGDNISEGFGRYHYQENIQFCRHSRGSLNETLNHFITALDEKYIDGNTLNEFRILFEKELKLLNGYIAYLKKAKENQ